MKQLVRITLLLVLAGPLSAQGTLMPPGAPGPVMKSLAQVEPRIDVATLNGDGTCIHVIQAPGSYYLSANVSGAPGRAGIAIQSSNVTLDLNGFSLDGASIGTHGIEIRATATANVTVRRGLLRGWPGNGVQVSEAVANVLLEDLGIFSCNGAGVASPGFAVKTTIRRCQIDSVKLGGIDLNGGGTVEDCTVTQVTGTSGGRGISANRVVRCSVDSVQPTAGFAAGITAESVQGCSVRAVISTSAFSVGISGSVVTDCGVSVVRGGGTGTVQGINARDAARCTVSEVGSAAAGTPTGIAGSTVTGCTVLNVGGSASLGPIKGIEAGVITQCVTTGIGNNSVAQAVTGIAATFGGMVSDCSVSFVQVGAAALRGITGKSITRCRVANLTQSGAAGGVTTYAAGIEAEAIIDCLVTSVSGATATGARGLSEFRTATGCQVSSVADSNGLSRLLSSTLPAVVDRCVLEDARQGIRLSAPGSRVTNTSISDVPTNGPETGYGIALYGAGCRVEGCTFSGTNSAGVALFADSAVIDSCSFSSLSLAVVSVGSFKATVTRNRLAASVAALAGGSGIYQTGPLVSATGDLSGTNPWANFRH